MNQKSNEPIKGDIIQSRTVISIPPAGDIDYTHIVAEKKPIGHNLYAEY